MNQKKTLNENAQNSLTAWYILIKFCMLLYYILDWELPGILSFIKLLFYLWP